MGFIVTVQDPQTGARRRLTVEGTTTGEAISAAGNAAPGHRVLNVQRDGSTAANDAAPDPPATPEGEPLTAFAAQSAENPSFHIRPARPSLLPYVAVWAFGVLVGGAGVYFLDGMDLPSIPGAAPASEPAGQAPPLGQPHGTNEPDPATVPLGGSADAEEAAPVATRRILNDEQRDGSIYRVISRDERTGYLYETFIRAQDKDHAAALCEERTHTTIVEVQRVRTTEAM